MGKTAYRSVPGGVCYYYCYYKVPDFPFEYKIRDIILIFIVFFSLFFFQFQIRTVLLWNEKINQIESSEICPDAIGTCAVIRRRQFVNSIIVMSILTDLLEKKKGNKSNH